MKLRKEYPFVWNYHEKVPISNPKSLYVRQVSWVSQEISRFAKEYYPKITEKELERFIEDSKQDVENDTATAEYSLKYNLRFNEYCNLLVRIRYRNSIYSVSPIYY
ncbi:MAG: hypothetical protein H0U27_04455 [Nitrosopumilus sp.]|nr:hypothetical protein [Nitrosopumilus sp.]